ncbi:MAG: hypothetical protein IKL80_02235, partial [Clostridia bacterium]|nr:hypothetical protein [Clostridia bacterium]
YYYKEDGEEKTLVSVSPTKNLRVTTAVTADGDEVSELSENQFNFYDAAEDENVSNKLDNKVHIIYNGKAIDNALDKLLESGSFSGRVRFIESSEPTLVIEEYVSVWAKTVQGSRNKIFDGLTETNMIFDADKEDIALFYKGVPILFSTLANNSVLTVYESKNQTGDKLIRINVSTAVEEGTVTAIEADRIYIDDYAYLKSKQATQDFWPGMQGYFLLNDCGEVVAYSEAVLAGEYRVGALTNFMIDTGINKVAKLQIFEDTNAFGEYDCAETVTIDGLKLKNADTIINGSAEFAGLANMSVQNTLIRYRANDSGQITMIDTHVTLGGGAEDTFTRLTGADAKFRFNGTSQLFTQAASGEYAIAPYKGTPALFGFKTAGDANTLFYGAKLTDYRSGSYAWNSESMTGEVYCLDKENPFVSHVIWQGAGGGTNWGYPFIVSEKSTIAINGETAVSIRGYRNNEACSFYIYSEEYKSNEPEMVNVRKILDYIQPGDALRVVASNEGEMKNCELMFLANGASVSPGGIAVKPNKDNGYGGLEAVSRLRATLFGEVVAVLDGFVQIEFAPDTYEYVKTTAGCMRYDYRNGKPVVENGLSIGEISIGDKVLYMAVDYQPRVLCIYEHPELD